jgi:predicted DsbA family dithiol-disulfide isomerase
MRIDLFHDTACPWCRIGKRHLQLALAQWPGGPVLQLMQQAAGEGTETRRTES